ncbi:hypothetical protein [Flavobacterium notoginsengisoli]|uniref:hypothetical protein n=1 Tax=Flavobacterium notoginsengisoli TaxID=1478199 RepID=UPI0036374E41
MKTYLLITAFLISISIKAQQESKDTIYFKYDNKYIKTYVEIPKHLYIKDASGTSSGNFYFTKIRNINGPKSKAKVICLKKFIRSSIFYNKSKLPKLNDYNLYEELNKFVIIFVKKTNGSKEYILVESSFEIE